MTFHLDVPGLGPTDVEIDVSGDVLTVRATRSEERGGGADRLNGRTRRERFTGSFARAVTLPPGVDGAKVEASYDRSC